MMTIARKFYSSAELKMRWPWGYTARALGTSIFTEADDWAQLQANVRDAVSCHFDEDEAPKVIRLHYVREEVLTL